MNALSKKLLSVSALAMLGTTGAQASIITPNTQPLGSEVVLTFVNAVGDSISVDTGDRVSTIAFGDSYTLDASVLSFIATAGGAGSVQFGLIGGNTTTRNYMTASSSATFADDTQVGNGQKSLWGASLSGLIQNLNTGDATPPATNLTYGPFVTGSGSPNYLDGGHDTWQSGNFEISNLANGADSLFLYTVQFAVANTGLASFVPLSNGLYANLNLASGSVNIVPVPAAVWLFGSALGLLSVAARRRNAAKI